LHQNAESLWPVCGLDFGQRPDRKLVCECGLMGPEGLLSW